MASQPIQPTELHVEMTLAGHEQTYFYGPDGRVFKNEGRPAICYFPDGQQMISGSSDKTTRMWDLQTGKERKEARVVNEHGISAVAVSRDGRWVITVCAGALGPGGVKAYELETGNTKILEGDPQKSLCIDISGDSKLLASGSWDGTTRIWSLDSGERVAGSWCDPSVPSRRAFVDAIRFSHNSKRFAVSLAMGKCLEVWNVETCKLDVRTGRCPASSLGFIASPPVFWTTQDRTIVAALSFRRDPNSHPFTIYEFDSSTLEVIGVPFIGHESDDTRNIVIGLALSSNCALLICSSTDDTVKLWAFGSRQLLASFHVRNATNLVFSPDSRQVAYTTLSSQCNEIYICGIPPDILATVWLAQSQPHISDILNSHATTRTRPAAVHYNQLTASFASPLSRHSPTICQQQRALFGNLRKLLPSTFRREADLGQGDKPFDLLDCPTISRFRGHSSLAPAALSGLATALPTSQPCIPPSTTIISRLRYLSNWIPNYIGHTRPQIINVPLAQGQKRNAAAGAPSRDDGYIRDEEFDSRPPSPSTDSQQVSTGEHGSNRFCFCL